jgi:hypothetical protein
VVNDDKDEEVTSIGEESEDGGGGDEDDDWDTVFMTDAIGAGCGQLQQVHPTHLLCTHCVYKLTLLSCPQILVFFVSVHRK